MARRKRRADPYADQSSAAEDDASALIDPKSSADGSAAKECRTCRHASAAVNVTNVRKNTKQARIGECAACVTAQRLVPSPDPSPDAVVWLCLFCGYQGCDRNTNQHALLHYRTPRSDKHCLILSTQHWTVWCYECNCEVVQASCKKLYEAVQLVKRKHEAVPPPEGSAVGHISIESTRKGSLAPMSTGRSRSAVRTLSPSSAGCRPRGSSATLLDDKSVKEHVGPQPKVKGINNMGNTCFFNSVMQVLSQTHLLTQLFDIQLQTGQRASLPGHPEQTADPGSNKKRARSVDPDLGDSDDDIELKPLELILPEGGSLSLALANFLKEMQGAGRNTLSPSLLFGQLCRKSSQFSGFEQQDAHELLRCLLETVRTEELQRAKRAILKAFALNEKTDPARVAPRVRKIIQGYGRQATHTIIDQIFGGQLISTVVCDVCNWSSQVFEPFMDLSLSLAEDKGKPKTLSNDDSVMNSFGRVVPAKSSDVSKHQLKKQKKLTKKNRRNKYNNKGKVGIKISKSDGGGGSEVAASPKREDVGDVVKKRLSEKRRPEDDAFMKKQAEEEEAMRAMIDPRVPINGVPSIVIGTADNESTKYKVLMQARTARRRAISAAEGAENSSEVEEDDEELEYDHDDDFDDYGSLNKKLSSSMRSLHLPGFGFASSNKSDTEKDSIKHKHLGSKNSLVSSRLNVSKNSKVSSKQTSDDNDEEEEEEEEEEDGSSDESDDEEEDDSDSDDKNGESDVVSAKKKENSDADEEDNAESEWQERITRQPSIIVVGQSEDYDGNYDGNTHDCRFLSSSASCDHLNYNSASDTSERYFTADGNGVDTGDDLDPPSRRSHSKESLLRAGNDDEFARRLCELKLQRKSTSRESLHRLHLKRPSAETLHSFRSCDRLTEEEDQLQPNVNPRKFRQEWLARSLTTLSDKYQARTQECSIMSCLANFTAPELLANSNKIICQNCTRLRNISGNNPTENVRSPASKQLMVVCPPAILTLQLKRFHHTGAQLSKANRFVQFPLVLDLAPFTSTIAMSPGCRVLYGLYGIVQHSGRLQNGHYTAYVRSRPKDSSFTPPTTYLAQQPLDSSKLESDPPPTLPPPPSKSSSNSPTVEALEEEVKTSEWYHVSDCYVSQVTIEKLMKAQAYLLFYERLV